MDMHVIFTAAAMPALATRNAKVANAFAAVAVVWTT